MKTLKLKKLTSILMSLVLLVGCGSSSISSDDSSSTNDVSSASESTTNQDLVYNLGTDPVTLDPTLTTSSSDSQVILNAFEGLMTLDENNHPIPATAESYEISEDGLVYTFKIREDAKWSDGEPVTAENFRYSWIRALSKETAAEYSYQLYYIKNGEKYFNGEVSADEVGVKALDDLTLEVTLESQTSYFLQLCSFTTYLPLREDIVSANPDSWATTPETYVSNGPFKLVQYDIKDQLVFVKNEHYWDVDSVKLDSLTYKMVTDESTAYAELKAGNFDAIASIPTNEIESALAEGLATISPSLGIYYLIVNVGKQDTLSEEVKEVLNNKLVRQALNLAIDRQEIIDNVLKSGQTAAYSFVPQGIYDDDGNDFASKEYYDPLDMESNLEKAKELLKEAGYENGEGLPTLELIYNSEGSHKDIMQIIQQNWAEIGVNVELANEEWAVFLTTRQSGYYQIARHGWIADYIDPMTFLDLFVTDGGNNDAGFSNSEYDALINSAKIETDAEARLEMLREAEDILMEEMPVFPLYYYNKVTTMNPNVKGVYSTSLGKLSFKYAYKE